MTVQDFTQIVRTRWMIICAAIVVAVLGALGYSLLATPQYQASTTLFVSTASDGTNTQTNDGGLFAQRRVLSYTNLLTGELLAQRTIQKLNLDMSVAELQREVKATAPTDTVLIYVTVTDPSPVRARDIANTLSDEFAGMAAGLETPDVGAKPNARVVVQQRANIPDSPVTPKTYRNVGIAVALGAVIGVLLAIIRDRLDDSVRSREAVEKATERAALAEIPFDKQRQRFPLISFESDRSAIAEAFRELRINLQILETGDGPRVILVASAMPEEGRTMTATNLSLALSEAGYHVVVVDADLRRPRVASLLGIPGQLGFSTVLTGQASLDDALQPTRFPRLTALASGAIPPIPTELLGSQAAKNVLRDLGSRFDYVIIDSASLAVTDALLLARSSQGVLLIARFGRTTRGRLATVVDALGRAGAPVLGAVLTMTPTKKRTPMDGYDGKAPDRSQDPRDRPARRRRGSHTK